MKRCDRLGKYDYALSESPKVSRGMFMDLMNVIAGISMKGVRMTSGMKVLVQTSSASVSVLCPLRKVVRLAIVAMMAMVFGLSAFVAIAEAAISYVGGTTANNTAGATTYNISLAGITGLAQGDLVIVATGFASNTADGNPGVTTSGYTEVLDLYPGGTRPTNLSVSYKFMGVTPDTQVTVSGSADTALGSATVVHVWRGVNLTTPMDVAAASATATGTNAPNSPAITPITAGAYVLTVGAGTRNNTAVTMTAPSGYGNVLSIQGQDTTMSFHVGVASKAWSGSGAEDPAAWGTSSSFSSDTWAAGTLALRPAPTGPTVNWTTSSQSSAGESGTLTVTAQLSASFGSDITVPFTVSGTATGGGTDYSITASPITITAGSTTGSATITITPDTLDENNETVILTMGTPSAGTAGATTVHTATITDDDVPPTVQFVSASGSGDEATTPATATATLSAASGLTVTVAYATANGSAVQPGDYTSTSGTLTFNPGETSKPINVPIIDDAAAELSEDFTVTLSGPTNATLGSPATFTYTIFDNENTPPTISAISDRTIDQDTATPAIPFTIGDAETPATSLTLSGASSNTTLVPVSNIVFGGSGANRTVTVTPAPGQNGTATITVTVTDGLGATADSVFVLTVNAISASTTTNGPSAVAGFGRIKVTAPYTGDNDAVPDNSLQVLVYSDAGYTSLVNDSGVITHSASPYSYTAGGLVNGTTYYVRVIYTDPDGVSGTGGTAINANNYRIDLGAFTPLDTLTHNSVNTSSSYWGGNWGTATGKYGEFTCTTCHTPGTSNIKRVRTTITTPDGTNWRNDAAEGPDVAVNYLDANETGGTDMGDDDPNGDGGATKRTTSVAVCEVCHSQVQYHRYNNSAQAVFSHNNKTDCVKCHAHSKGFKASCDACHGNPPITADNDGSTNTGLAHFPAPTGSLVPGAHGTHTASIACEICHAGSAGNGSTHNSGNVTITFANLPTGTGGVNGGNYSGQTGVSYDVTDGGTTQVPPAISNDGTMTCAVYCHGSSIGGNNPTWDGAVVCGDCHGATATNPPGSPASFVSHATHAGNASATGSTTIYQGGAVALTCASCHGTVGAPSVHVDGNVPWNVTALPSATTAQYRSATTGSTGTTAPSGAWGTCANVSCHYGTTTPSWNTGPATQRCTVCHSDGTTAGTGSLDNAAPATGAHSEHIQANDTYVSCADCHGAGATTASHAGHIDFSTTINAAVITSWNAATGSCVNTCHQNADWGTGSGTKGITWTQQANSSSCNPALTPSPAANGTEITDYCLDCHDSSQHTAGPGIAASGTWNIATMGTHLNAKLSNNNPGCIEDEKNLCLQCHVTHTAASKDTANAVYIPTPNNATVAAALGLDQYTGTKHFNSINLRKAAAGFAAQASEAEICWSCHDSTRNGASRQSEWFGPAYNGFDLTGTGTSSNWVSQNFDPAGALIPVRQTRSVHTANMNVAGRSSVADTINADGTLKTTGFTLEGTTDIRCTYCHDVHNTHGPNGGDTISPGPGSPQGAWTYTYLRGTWLPNSYLGYSNTGNGTDVWGAAEIPPWDHNAGNADKTRNYRYYSATGNYNTATAAEVTNSQASVTIDNTVHNNWAQQGSTQATGGTNVFVNLPRLWATSRPSARQGGYFIDQNTGWPTRKAGGTFMTVSETAGICTACHGTDVDNMDQYANGANELWRGANNGHSNSTLGGSGAGSGNDIFSARRGFANNVQWGMHNQPSTDDAAASNRWGNGSGAPTSGTSLPFGDYFRNTFRPDNGTNNRWPAPFNTGWYDEAGEGGKTRIGSVSYDSWFVAPAIGTGADSTASRAHNFSCSKCHTPHASGLPALLMTNCLDMGISTWVAYGQGGTPVVGPSATDQYAVGARGNCHNKSSTSTGWHRLAPE